MVFAFYILGRNWVFESSLTKLTGTLQKCDIYIEDVTSKSKFNYETITRKAELIFYLNEYKKKFLLTENIDKDYRSGYFEKIKSELEIADSIKISLRKSELDDWQPTVFQIDTESKTILSLNDVRFKDASVAIFLLLLGLSSGMVAYFLLYPRHPNNSND